MATSQTPDEPITFLKSPALYSFQPQDTRSPTPLNADDIQTMAKVHKIVITRDIGEKAMAILEQESQNFKSHLQIWSEPGPADRAWLLHNIQEASGVLIMFSDKVDDEFLAAAGPSLKVISTMSVGHDHISLPAVAKRGIRLGYTPDVLTDAVADICIMLALMASRNARIGMKIVENGEWANHPWSPFIFCGAQLSASPNKVAGFLGYGRISQATAHRLAAFGITKVIYTNSSSPSLDVEPIPRAPDFSSSNQIAVSQATLATHSDVLFILAPHTPQTHHIVNTKFLNLMKPTSILVNAARGPLVDSDALAAALQQNKIFGAGLDVIEGEPSIPSDHPLLKQQTCTILPHIGSATFETREDMACLAARNLLKGLLDKKLDASVDLSEYKDKI
ncbi:hypothetical protein BU17DRAFT_99228 [Hysterangium stoloniferum]|nr:hypothetical protein BU17DRAFT_99228 [Hysterangium stoloniferum]